GRGGLARWSGGIGSSWRIEGVEQRQRRANLGGALHRVERPIARQQVQDRDFRESPRCPSGWRGDLPTVAGVVHLRGPALDKRLDAARPDGIVLMAAPLLVGQYVPRPFDQLARAIGLFSRPRRNLLHATASLCAPWNVQRRLISICLPAGARQTDSPTDACLLAAYVV